MALAQLDWIGGGGSKVDIGVFTISSSSDTTVNIGFRPKRLTIWYTYNDTTPSTGGGVYLYDEDLLAQTPNKYMYGFKPSGAVDLYSLGSTDVYRLKSVTDNGFVFTNGNSTGYGKFHYIAVGE